MNATRITHVKNRDTRNNEDCMGSSEVHLVIDGRMFALIPHYYMSTMQVFENYATSGRLMIATDAAGELRSFGGFDYDVVINADAVQREVFNSAKELYQQYSRPAVAMQGEDRTPYHKEQDNQC